MGVIKTIMAAAVAANTTGDGQENLTLSGIKIESAVTACSTNGELSPSGELRPGEEVWVREPDLGGNFDGFGNPACTADGNLYPRNEPKRKVCTVPPWGLNVGKGPNAEPGKSSPTIFRDSRGFCYTIDPAKPSV